MAKIKRQFVLTTQEMATALVKHIAEREGIRGACSEVSMMLEESAAGHAMRISFSSEEPSVNTKEEGEVAH